MKTRKPWLPLAFLLIAMTVAAIALPTSLAFLFSRSNTVHNSFRVEYLPPKDISVPVSVQKIVLNLGTEEIGPGGFSFRLMNLNTSEVTAMTSFSDGTATLNLPFTADDLGKTYSYRLYELEGDRQHMLYDTTVYDITITLRLDDQHEMVADLTLNGKPVTEIVAKFVNVYEPVIIPPTGDDDQPLFWLAALVLCGVALTLLCKNSHTNRRLLWIRSKSVS